MPSVPPARRGSKLHADLTKPLTAPPLARPGKPKALPEAKTEATSVDSAALRTRVVLASILMVSTFLIGIFGYHAIDPAASWTDAVYMTANAITTAGFREAIKMTPSAEIFTIFLLVFGAGTVVYFTAAITAFVVEGDLTQNFRRRRMMRQIQMMSDHFVVCGAGNAGLSVLNELAATRRPTVVIEADAARAKRVEEHFPQIPVMVGDSTNDDVLIEAGVQRARGVVICIDDDKDSLVVTVTSRQLNPRARIVARATDERGVERIKHAGADAVIAPSHIGGMRMASEMVRPSVVGFLDKMLRDRDRNLRIEEIEVPAGSGYAGKRVGEIDFRGDVNLLLLAVHQPDGGVYVYNPPLEHQVVPGSQLIVMGDPDGVQRMRDRAKAGA
ncbi:MAG TPA: NAD-binding protein [Gemmatimonadaceae bacterium]